MNEFSEAPTDPADDHGDLSEIGLAELFTRLSQSVATGTLHVRHGADHWLVHWTGGEARAPLPERLEGEIGRRMVELEIIGEGPLLFAETAMQQYRRPFHHVVVAEGFATLDQLETAVRDLGVEGIRALIESASGIFEFVADESAELSSNRPSFDVGEVVRKIASGGEEWRGVLERIGSVDETFIVVPDADPQVELTGDHAEVIAAIDGKRCVREVADVTGMKLSDCAGIVAELLQNDLVAVAKSLEALSEARACLESDDHDKAVQLVDEVLAGSAEHKLETLLEAAEILEKCGALLRTATALAKAARLVAASDPDRREELARRALELDGRCTLAIEQLREHLVSSLGDEGTEWIELTNRLADAYAKDRRFGDALEALDGLKSEGEANTELMERRVSILQLAGRSEEASQALSRLAEVLEERGEAEALKTVYERFLTVDSGSLEVAKNLRKLRTAKLRRFALIGGPVAALLLIGLVGIPHFQEQGDAARETELGRQIEETLERGDVATARVLLDEAIVELGERDLLRGLRSRLSRAEASDRTRRKAEGEELDVALARASTFIADGDMPAALELFAQCAAESRVGRKKSRAALEAELETLCAEWAALRKQVVSLENPSATVAATLKLGGTDLRKLERDVRTRSLPMARRLVTLESDPSVMALLSPERVSSVIVAATAVTEAGQILAELLRQHGHILELDGLNQVARDHEAALEFEKARDAYRRLAAEHPAADELKLEFESKAARYETIIRRLQLIRLATADGDHRIALNTLERLEQDNPGVPFAGIVHLPMRFETQPPGAIVAIADQVVGRTPLVVPFAPDQATAVQVTLDGFEPVRATVGDRETDAWDAILVKAPDWTVKLGGSVQEIPVFDTANRVFVVDRSGVVTALDTTTGDELWRFESGDISGFLTGPVLFRDRLVIGSGDGTLRALRRDSGKLVWEVEDVACEGSPALVGQTIVVGTVDGEAVGVAADSGAVRYRTKLPGSVATPVRSDRARALMGTGNGYVVCVEGTTGAIVWRRQLGSIANFAHHAESVATVSFAGRVTLMHTRDGRRAWSKALDGVRSAPVFDGDTVWIADGDVLREHRRDNGAPTKTVSGVRDWIAPPAPVRGGALRLAARADGWIEALDGETLELRYLIAGAKAATEPVIAAMGNQVVIGLESRRVHMFLKLP